MDTDFVNNPNNANNLDNSPDNTDFTTTIWYTAFEIDQFYLVSEGEISGNAIELDEQLIQETLTLKPMYNVQGGVYISATDSTNDIVIPIDTETNVTRDQLVTLINTALYTNEYTRGSYVELLKDSVTSKSITKIRWNINKLFTTQDYRLVFYDIYSFVKCNESTRSYRNATIDNTLGWILGYRTLTEYSLTSDSVLITSATSTTSTNYYKNPFTLLSTGSKYTYTQSYLNDMTENPSSVQTSLEGDTTVSVNLYNYFMIVLDDFNQNHLNDGLVTVTKRDNSVTLPSYANRKKYTCDPVTG